MKAYKVIAGSLALAGVAQEGAAIHPAKLALLLFAAAVLLGDWLINDVMPARFSWQATLNRAWGIKLAGTLLLAVSAVSATCPAAGVLYAAAGAVLFSRALRQLLHS